MKVVLQRVARASVLVDDETVGEIGHGVVALVGAGRRSTREDAAWLASKTEGLRIFPDDEGRMNRSLADAGGAVLAISQFTLYGNTSKGRRPSFVDAAEPDRAKALYERYCEALPVPVQTGVFGAYMLIDLTADGPVTLRLVREHGGD
jgi:D-aminoacyl-tRNA deacylase